MSGSTPNTLQSLRLLLVDDHQLFADAMRSLLEKHWPGIHIQSVFSGEDVEACLQENAWDLVMMDLGLPGLDGLTLVGQLAERWPDLPVLICTGEVRPAVLNRVIKSAARGVITKSQPADQILEAIRAVFAGRRYLCSQALDALESPATPEEDLLTERQLAILALLQDGLSNSDIAERLFVSPNTVKTHLRLIFEKLGVNNRVECVRVAHERGLL
ncbi:MAG: response regulator [Oceanobacter sp.]